MTHILQQPWAAQLKRNPSYRASLKTTAVRVIFYGPSAWWWLVSPHLKMVLLSAANFIVATLIWIMTTIVLIGGGLFGFVSVPVLLENDDDPAPPAAGNGDSPQES